MFVFLRHRSNTGQVPREPLQSNGRGHPPSGRLDRWLDHPWQEVLHRPQHEHYTLEPPSGEGGAPSGLGESGVGWVWGLLRGSHQQEGAVSTPLCSEVRHQSGKRKLLCFYKAAFFSLPFILMSFDPFLTALNAHWVTGIISTVFWVVVSRSGINTIWTLSVPVCPAMISLHRYHLLWPISRVP